MTEYELINLIKRVLAREIAQVVMGEVLSNETESRSTVKRFPNEAPKSNIRSVQPFGFASKAPAGTQAFLVPAGNDRSNQNILGHFDEGNKPALKDGETALYDAFGNIFLISNGKFQLGSETSSEPLVLGNQLKALLSTLLTDIATHTHPGIGSPPSNASAFTALKSSPVGDGAILSEKSFTE